jgi:tripartite-type tricarboxylate transporter receptor subunit TctC
MRDAIAKMAAAMVLGLFCTAATAQAYPSKPVRVVVAFSAGGAVDLVARIAGQKLTEMLGQSFVVDYKLGANGLIGGA